MWNSIGKGPIWSFLEIKILRKIGEMVKKSKKLFSLFWCIRPPETPLCWQNSEKVTPRLYSHSILHGNKGSIWSISVAAMYSECKATRKQVPRSQKLWHTRLHQTGVFEKGHGCVPISAYGTGLLACSSKCDCAH